jgi:hypothetical protein
VLELELELAQVARVARAAPLVSAASTRTLCPPWRCALGIFCFCSGSGCGDHLGLVGLGRSSAVCGFGFRVEMHHHGRACALPRQCVCGCPVQPSQPGLRGTAGCLQRLWDVSFLAHPVPPSTLPLTAVAHWWWVLTPPSPPNPLLSPSVACVWADGRWSDLRAGHRGACAVHGPLPPRSCGARQAGGTPAHRCRAQGAAAHGRADDCVLLCVCVRVCCIGVGWVLWIPAGFAYAWLPAFI